MLDRRHFLRASAALPLAFTPSSVLLAQGADRPDFDVAGSATTDPVGYEILWANGWNEVDVTPLTFQPVPGEVGFVVLDSDEREEGQRVKYMAKQRVVFETTAESRLVDPEELLNSFEDLHPSTHMGFAPGTVIESRHVTDLGCWFSFGPGPNAGGIEGVIGLSLYYTPAVAGAPLLNVMFSLADGSFRTEEFLEEMDSTIAINGNWLLGMDDLGNFWEAIRTSYGWYD